MVTSLDTFSSDDQDDWLLHAMQGDNLSDRIDVDAWYRSDVAVAAHVRPDSLAAQAFAQSLAIG